MTNDVEVADSDFDALRPHFNPRELVELTVTIAAYNAMSRLLVALKVDVEASHGTKT